MGDVDDGRARISRHPYSFREGDDVAGVTLGPRLVVPTQLGRHVARRIGEDPIVPRGLPDGEDTHARSHSGEPIIGWLRGKNTGHKSAVFIAVAETVLVGIEVSQTLQVTKSTVRVDTCVDNSDSLPFAFGEVPNRAGIDQRMELLGTHVMRQMR